MATGDFEPVAVTDNLTEVESQPKSAGLLLKYGRLLRRVMFLNRFAENSSHFDSDTGHDAVKNNVAATSSEVVVPISDQRPESTCTVDESDNEVVYIISYILRSSKLFRF